MKTRRLLVSGIVALSSLTATASQAADVAYLSVKAHKQGDIKGDVTQKGHEHNLAVRSWSYGVQTARETGSGMATGRRQHKPLTVTLDIGKATPQFLQACFTNEAMDIVKLEVMQPTATGESATALKLTLENAMISDVRLVSGSDSHSSTAASPTQMEVSFTFHKIAVESPAGTSTKDDWSGVARADATRAGTSKSAAHTPARG